MRLVCLLVLLVATTAWARPRPSPTPPPRAQRMEFDDDEVNGTLLGPEGDPVPGKPPIGHPSLIRVRQTFVPELLRSADTL
jgi:hypothetical protein